MNMHHFLEIFTIERSFRYTISHTWELIVFRIELEELRSSTEEISRWKLESTSLQKKSRELNDIEVLNVASHRNDTKF